MDGPNRRGLSQFLVRYGGVWLSIGTKNGWWSGLRRFLVGICSLWVSIGTKNGRGAGLGQRWSSSMGVGRPAAARNRAPTVQAGE